MADFIWVQSRRLVGLGSAVLSPGSLAYSAKVQPRALELQAALNEFTTGMTRPGRPTSNESLRKYQGGIISEVLMSLNWSINSVVKATRRVLQIEREEPMTLDIGCWRNGLRRRPKRCKSFSDIHPRVGVCKTLV